MRDRDRLELKPGEYQDYKRAERRRILGELLADLERRRGTREYQETLRFAQWFNRRPLIATGSIHARTRSS